VPAKGDPEERVSGPTIETGARRREAVFREVALGGSALASCDFEECRFVRCDFSESEARACRFAECTFEHCDLSLIRLSRSTFSACRFEDSKIIGVNWTEAAWPATRLWVPVCFERCVLNHSTFLGLELREVRIIECTAHDVDFREADLARADFSGTDLTGSLFTNTKLTGADLRSARNYRIDPRENALKGARFSLPEAISLLNGLDIDLTGWEP
jgi:uncharacterized protein YjbI with pentapeptide repeats